MPAHRRVDSTSSSDRSVHSSQNVAEQQALEKNDNEPGPRPRACESILHLLIHVLALIDTFAATRASASKASKGKSA